MVLLSTAVLFAGHILVIDTFGQKMDPILLSFGQISTTALLSWIGSLCEGSIDWADHTSLHRLRADFHRHRARTGSGENTTIAA